MNTPSQTSQPLATLLCAVLAAGALVCAWQAVQAHGIATAARQAKDREVVLREEAELQARIAVAQNLETQLVLAFFQTEVLTAKSSAGGPQTDTTLSEALDRAEPVIAATFSDRPLLEASVRSAMSVSYQHLKKFDAAIDQLQRAIELRRQSLGPHHPATLGMLNNLGVTYQRAGLHNKSLPLLEETLRLKTAALGADHHESIISSNNLALAYCQTQCPAKAVALMEECLQRSWVRQNPDHPDTLTCMHTLAGAYQDLKQFGKAIPILENMLRLRRATAGPFDSAALRIMESLASALTSANDVDKAEALSREWVALHESRSGPEHTGTVLARIALAINLLQQLRYGEAEGLLRQCLATLERTEPDSWTYYNAQSLLGATLLGQARDETSADAAARETKFSLAEQALQSGYQGLNHRLQDIPDGGRARFTEALQRLVELYNAWGKLDESAKWQTKTRCPRCGATKVNHTNNSRG